MIRLFGTDGIRGTANEFLSPELTFAAGKAVASLTKGNSEEKKTVLIARDTRISGNLLSCSLAAGLMSCGACVLDAGIIPTPAITFLIRHFKADAAVMISASHNPFEDNGIKIFGADGLKLTDAEEDSIQEMIENRNFAADAGGADIGILSTVSDAEDIYINAVCESMPYISLHGVKAVLDCSNGAAYRTAERLFSLKGAETSVIFSSPDGININDSCGSVNPKNLAQKVVDCGADIGLAFDGDGDRVCMTDENGKIYDGDAVMFLCAVFLRQNGLLNKDTIAATVLSNAGLELSLNKAGINVIRTQVGDRYIQKELISGGLSFGGEQSGHMILKDINTTGDGTACGLLIAHILAQSGMKLSECLSEFRTIPQVSVNIAVKKENRLIHEQDDELKRIIDYMTQKYSRNGRILIRPSGTESVLRVMIESDDSEDTDKDISVLKAAVKDAELRRSR